jgi:1-aminocyclopropane-1-carboxylate deaminase/D-cysteine desulfhydrase-like pyridoxal-dependent ACC family enzyme
MGADVRLVKAGFGIAFKESWEQALADVVAGAGKPYAIPAGASDHPLGGLGFASWAREVEMQEAELGYFSTRSSCARLRAQPRQASSLASPTGRASPGAAMRDGASA